MKLVVAIDPGHGLGNVKPGVYDPGAVAGGHTEADLALLLGLSLKHSFSKRGIRCILTRDSHDDPAPLSMRVARMENSGANLYISLHMNAAGPFVSGTETFYRDVEDEKLARIIQGAACQVGGLKDRGVKTEDMSPRKRLAVLAFRGPACLLEWGFITHNKDRGLVLRRDIRLAWADLTATRVEGVFGK